MRRALIPSSRAERGDPGSAEATTDVVWIAAAATPPRDDGTRAPASRCAPAVLLMTLTLSGAPAQAACHDVLLPVSSLEFRRELQPHIRAIGITGFGRTQPYGDATISTFMASEVNLIVREQDDLAIEIGAEVPLPAEPIELAKFNALTAFAASRFSGEDEAALRARLLGSMLQHPTPAAWSEQSNTVRLSYRRETDALIVKMRKQVCE